MNVEALQTLLAKAPRTIVLDIRPKEQREEWSIPGSRFVDAYDAVRARDFAIIDALELPADAHVVTVCAAGYTSKLAADRLRARGVNVESLEGGMHAWSLAWNVAEVRLLGDVTVVQVRRTGKGCLSYIVGCDGEAVVIDPSVGLEAYTRLAAERGLSIVAVIETHVHADHLSRARALSRLTGATLHMPAQDRVTFPFAPLQDGDQVKCGSTHFDIIATPGHTRESIVCTLPSGAAFTGDTLFVDGVGRPDLEADAAEARARGRALHGSLARITALPGDTLILPAHASAPIPFDGKMWGAALNEIRARVRSLHLDEDAFVAAILTRVLPTPANYHTIVALNESGEWPKEDPEDLEAGANHCAAPG